jgi:hypothetical protein
LTDLAIMILLVALGWLALGIVVSLLLGPLLARQSESFVADDLDYLPEPEPVVVREPARRGWRVGVAAAATALAASTGMAAAGALPPSAQSVAHRVLLTVGLDVPKPAGPSDRPAPRDEVATGPAEEATSDGASGGDERTSDPGRPADPTAPPTSPSTLPPADGDRRTAPGGDDPGPPAGGALTDEPEAPADEPDPDPGDEGSTTTTTAGTTPTTPSTTTSTTSTTTSTTSTTTSTTSTTTSTSSTSSSTSTTAGGG